MTELTTTEKPLDVLIIGAGPAGTLAAAQLHTDGFKVLIVEKQQFPRFVIGESLLPSCMGLLEDAGLLPAVEHCAFMRKYGAVFRQGDQTCNFDFANQFTPGWKYTYQVPRADFDQALANAVVERGVPILYRHAVKDVVLETPGEDHAIAVIEQRDGAHREVRARFILDCSGYGRVLPRLLDLEEPSTLPPREALFTHVTGDHRPSEREEGKIWICIHPEGAWIWIIPFSNGNTSVGVVGDPSFFKQFSGTPEEQLRAILMTEPNSAGRLEQTQMLFPPQRISGYACSVKQLYGPRFALVGNATEFLDPIFSSGVALALESSRRAAQVTARQLRGEAVNWQADYADYVMQGINTFRAFVEAWYDRTLPRIFFAAQRNPGIMKQICSVLAGYAWDKTNPYVTQPQRALPLLARIVQGRA